MKKFIYEFINEKGWAHFTVMLAIIYILIFWGNSDYAQSTKLFPSEMVASITNQLLFWQLVIYLMISFVIGSFNEWCQGVIFKVKNWQMSDIWSGMLAVPCAFFIPINWFVFSLAMVIILTAIYYNVELLRDKFKK